MEKLLCAQCRPPCPLGEISPQQMWALDGLIRPVSFLPGQVLFEQGDPHRGCYLLCDGAAMLFRRAPEGRRSLLALSDQGISLGWGAFWGKSAMS